MRDGVRLEFRVRVGEGEDLCARSPDEVVDDCRFAASEGKLLHPDPTVARGAGALRRRIAAAVAADRDGEASAVALREEVRDARADRSLFVVRRDQYLDGRKCNHLVAHTHRRVAGETSEESRISDRGPGEKNEGQCGESGRGERQPFVSDRRRRSSRENDRPIESHP